MSAFTLQLSDARNSSIRNVAGVCANGDAFVQQINDVTRHLLKRGGWWGTELLAEMCLDSCDVAWPGYMGTVLGLRFCDGQMVIPKNNWWSIVGPRGCCNSAWSTPYGGWYGTATMYDIDNSPCQREISSNTGKYIKYHVVKTQDTGKTLTLYGFQYGGQPLQESDGSGGLKMGLTVHGGQTTTILVTQITSVVRERTEGMTYLYEVSPSDSTLRDLATYYPNETNPSYRRSRIQNYNSIGYRTDTLSDGSQRKLRKVTVLFKLEYQALVNDWDFLIIPDLDALKYGVQAYLLDEAQDYNTAEVFWQKAIKELNMEIRNKTPALETVVRINSTSSDCLILNPI